MRSLRTLPWLAALAVGMSACSLGLDFDPEGQPCDTRNQCLPGYACDAGTCVSSGTGGDGGVRADGGTSGGALCGDGQPCPAPAEAR